MGDADFSTEELVSAGHILVSGRPMEFWLPKGMTAEDIGVEPYDPDDREPLLSA